MKISSSIKPIKELSSETVMEMLEIMRKHYANVTSKDFLQDLSSKNDTILLHNENNTLVGFSTLQYFFYKVKNQDAIILFSGDTIITKEYWGSIELPIAFSKYALSLLNKYEDKKLYWLLISKGVRTYKFLSVFYNEFYPHYRNITPIYYQKAIDEIAYLKFKNNYDKENGIILASENGQFLKNEYQPDTKSRNPHIIYYYKRNPDYWKGNELVCFAEFSFTNLCKYFQNVILKFV